MLQCIFVLLEGGSQFWPRSNSHQAMAPGRKPFGLIADFRIYARCLSDDEAQLGLGRFFSDAYGSDRWCMIWWYAWVQARSALKWLADYELSIDIIRTHMNLYMNIKINIYYIYESNFGTSVYPYQLQLPTMIVVWSTCTHLGAAHRWARKHWQVRKLSRAENTDKHPDQIVPWIWLLPGYGECSAPLWPGREKYWKVAPNPGWLFIVPSAFQQDAWRLLFTIPKGT